MFWSLDETEIVVSEKKINIASQFLSRDVSCSLFIPEVEGPLSLLILNDGQEAEALNLLDTLERLYNHHKIKPVVIAAVHAGTERLQEYGTAGQPDFKGRGSKADAYTSFVIKELLPLIKKEAGVTDFEIKAIAGFSLSGLSALDIAWNNSACFDKVGIFSGSLWWRTKDLHEGYTNDDRIMHRIVRESSEKPELEFWLQTGTRDEKADRNKNGIIDSIDDTVDLIRELEHKGYTRPADITYVEMVGGEHHITTWAKAFPKFLCWAFGG